MFKKPGAMLLQYLSIEVTCSCCSRYNLLNGMCILHLSFSSLAVALCTAADAAAAAADASARVLWQISVAQGCGHPATLHSTSSSVLSWLVGFGDWLGTTLSCSRYGHSTQCISPMFCC